MLNFLAGIIVMIIFSVISSIPIFIVGYCCKKHGGYSKGIAWLLTIVCVFIYIVIRVVSYEAAGIEDAGKTPVPIVAMIIIYCLANIFVNKNKLSLFDADEDYQRKKKAIENQK